VPLQAPDIRKKHGSIGPARQIGYRQIALRFAWPFPALASNREFKETSMAVDGNWTLTMSTPMGERNATLNITSAGGALTGTQGADGNSAEIFDGTVNGDELAWKVSITNPMPLTLAFTGKVSGDNMTGEMGIGMMGSFPFTGVRA
jgi:hypothetical protein